MNKIVAVFAVAAVVGGALLAAHVWLGQWATLMWAVLGWVAFIGICRRANA